MSESTYVPPKVWQWKTESGGQFASINRPIAGATHQAELPVGKHPLQLYSLATPNGVKVTILLEELLALGIKEAEYDAHLIEIMEGDQFGSGFVDVNPNSKIPALVDNSADINGDKRDGNKLPMFESGAILLYLAEKFDAFIPKEPLLKSQCLAWLFWQVGSGPYLGGGFGHLCVCQYPHLNNFHTKKATFH
jgi:GST-like protein